MTIEHVSPWPVGFRGALSLTFDDGLPSQLQKAVPILSECDLRATFYVNPRGEDPLFGLAPWRELAAVGHEIGNHTIRHICSKAFNDDPEISCLECLSLPELEAEIVEASRRLRAGIPDQPAFSFCYPCYQDYVGEGLTRQSYVPIIAKHFLAARGRGEFGHNHPATCDLAYLWSWNVEQTTGPALIGLAEQAVSMGRWAIFTIHGIDEGHLPLSQVAFAELCRFLARNRDTIWTAPVVEVATRINAWRAERSAAH
jgi:peptidoglycan-N-acetylglucosamine deacetylase